MNEDCLTYELDVSVQIRAPYGSSHSGDRLTVHESIGLGKRTFAEIAAVLQRFHGLGDRLKAEALGEDQAAETADDDQADAQLSRAVRDYTGSVQDNGGSLVGTSPAAEHQADEPAPYELTPEEVHILEAIRQRPRELVLISWP